jgi:hypothetical protein
MIAVPIVWMVQVAVHYIIDMVPMRNRGMSAIRAVNMSCLVPLALMSVGASPWVVRIYRKYVLVIMLVMRVMQMSVMKIIHMSVVHNCQVSAAASVNMRVFRMNVMRHQSQLLSLSS